MDANVPCQIHVAPVALAVDERAFQVFRGFTGDAVYRHLVERFGADSRLESVGPYERLGDLEGVSETLEYRVHPVRDDHPGGLYGLVAIVDRLLGPGGCPWDQEQTHESLKACLIEEAYELLDAIDAQDADALTEELGDVLLQPVMHAQMDARDGGRSIDAVAREVTEKLVRRHPHVFGAASADTADEVLARWDEAKRGEKQGRSLLAGVSRSLPALQRAQQIGSRAARAGFDWPDVEGVWAKLDEEAAELKEAWATERAKDELGDLLFSVVNLARWAGVDAEEALRAQADRFTTRFQRMESAAPEGLHGKGIEELEALWQAAKAT